MRDFSNESAANFIFRLIRSISIRTRGLTFAVLRVFHNESSSKIIFGLQPKFMNSKSIKISKNSSFGNFARIECYKTQKGDCKIVIGENASFGDYLHIGAINEIRIGNNVLGGSKILILDHNHGNPINLDIESSIPPTLRELTSKGKIVIEDNVWIGESVIILAGAYISHGAIIPANSIVKGYVPAKSVYKNLNNE